MKLLRYVLIGVVAIAVLAVAGYFLFQRQISQGVFERALADNMSRDALRDLDDGLHLFVCGSGSPLPDPSRAGPCLGVLAGQRAFIIDAGSGGARRLGRMGFPFERIERIYLTHLHSDHIDGLGEMLLQSWVAGGRTSPTPVAGPVGVEDVVGGFNMAYRLDSTYRVAHHGEAAVHSGGFGAVSEILPRAPAAPVTVVDDGGLTIDVLEVNHPPIEPAYGFRVRYGGRSIVISGDTTYHPALVEAATDADLLVHEALQPMMVSAMSEAAREAGRASIAKVMHDILDYHASPEDAARAASEAKVDALLLYHIVPPLPSPLLKPLFLGDAAKVYSGPITIAEDGMLISLPSGSERIDTRKVR